MNMATRKFTAENQRRYENTKICGELKPGTAGVNVDLFALNYMVFLVVLLKMHAVEMGF